MFLMSSVLQESGFEADEIRVVLNERATAQDEFTHGDGASVLFLLGTV